MVPPLRGGKGGNPKYDSPELDYLMSLVGSGIDKILDPIPGEDDLGPIKGGPPPGQEEDDYNDAEEEDR